MRKLLSAVLIAAISTAAYGDNAGTVANHAFAIGKGPTVQGYTSLLCGSGQIAIGSATDPVCRTVSGDGAISAAGVLTLSTVNSNVGAFGSSTQCPTITVNGKGLITAASQTACTPSAVTSITPGGGIVSSIATSCLQTAITSTGTLAAAHCINSQSGASYAIVDGDRAKLILAQNAGAQAYSIGQAGTGSAFQSGWYTDIENNSSAVASIITITPTTSQICAQGTCAATYKIAPGQFARITSDGTNYQVTFNPVALAYARATSAPGNPSSTVSAAAVMMGLAGSFTPRVSGQVLMQTRHDVSNSVVGDGCVWQLQYGTGGAPANGAASTGTSAGSPGQLTEPAAGAVIPASSLGMPGGLTLNTTYWYDLSLRAVTGGTCALFNITMVATEQ